MGEVEHYPEGIFCWVDPGTEAAVPGGPLRGVDGS
jgi:hypothetical protein